MGKDGKPRGKMTAYAFFVQTCREEHRKKYPGEQIVFADFSKRCAEKWKTMTSCDRKRFDDMAEQDKIRYENDMMSYVPPIGGTQKVQKRKRTKDPNAPKRGLSAFFFFCNEYRLSIRQANPGFSVGDVARELGRRWEVCSDREKYEVLAAQDRLRYEQDILAYRQGTFTPSDCKQAKTSSIEPYTVQLSDDIPTVEDEAEETNE